MCASVALTSSSSVAPVTVAPHGQSICLAISTPSRSGLGESDRCESKLANLIWRGVCQGGDAGGVLVGAGSAWEAAGLADARRLVRLIFAGWVAQDRGSA